MNTKQTIANQFSFLLLLFVLLTSIAAAQPLPPAQTPVLTATFAHSWTQSKPLVAQDWVQSEEIEAAMELLQETRDFLLLNVEIQYGLYIRPQG